MIIELSVQQYEICHKIEWVKWSGRFFKEKKRKEDDPYAFEMETNNCATMPTHSTLFQQPIYIYLRKHFMWHKTSCVARH